MMSNVPKRHFRALGVASTFVLLLASNAAASTITFNFNALAAGANSLAVQSNMNGVLGAAGSVVVTGATANQAYNGDGHVVGPAGTSLTLGNTEGGNPSAAGPWDTFLLTQGDPTEITMLFSGLTISSVEFDYEIFPDATCTSGISGSHCLNGPPDFTFKTNGTSPTSLGVTSYGVVPSGSSPASSTETAAQLGPTHVSFANVNATYLEFMDWPATIGIDNLKITTLDTNPTGQGTTPEPASLVLLGTGLASLVSARRRKLKQR